MGRISTQRIFQIVVSALLATVLVINFNTALDRKAAEPLADSFQRALITYGVVRGINAVVSVIQGTEVAIEPAGVGVILKPGEVFDPINDLIERFSWIVLVASTSLGAQRILVGVGATVFVQGIVFTAVAFQLLLLWRPTLLSGAWRSLIFRLSFLAILLRFLIPILVLANDVVYDSFLDAQYQESYSQLEQTEADVRAMQESENSSLPEGEASGILDQIGRIYDRTAQSINVGARLSEYEERLSSASEQIIDLIVVFILQTLIFPLLFLWLGLKLARILMSSTLLFAHTQK